MGGIAAIGEAVRVQGLGLAGVLVLPGEDDDQVRARWSALSEDIAVVILTPRAAQALSEVGPGPLRVVMPG
jgi:vacuolar-type H+-ATPase subunit F/Vma7